MTVKIMTFEEVSKMIFDDLIAVNVNDHTEKKGNLTYLSWAWAYQTMMTKYPTFTYCFNEAESYPDGTMMVNCTTSITIAEHIVIRTMWLPVMDYRNKAVSNPDSMAINTAKMRCLTKCISMHGLGSYIYAGEDLPQEEGATPPPKKVAPPKKSAAGIPLKPTPKKAAPEPEKDEGALDPNSYIEIADDDEAERFVGFMIKTAKEMHSDSMESLMDFWKKNLEAINYLNSNFNDHFESLKNAFTEIKLSLTEQF